MQGHCPGLLSLWIGSTSIDKLLLYVDCDHLIVTNCYYIRTWCVFARCQHVTLWQAWCNRHFSAGLTVHRSSTHDLFTLVIIYVFNTDLVIICRVGNVNGLVFSITRYCFLSNTSLTSGITWNCWYIVTCPFASRPRWVSVFSKIDLLCQSGSLLNCCCLTVWHRNIDRSSGCLFDIWDIDTS